MDQSEVSRGCDDHDDDLAQHSDHQDDLDPLGIHDELLKGDQDEKPTAEKGNNKADDDEKSKMCCNTMEGQEEESELKMKPQ